MRILSGGYTIVEIMIFLAVSSVIFVGAQLAFQGQQGKSQFEQGMHDMAAVLEQYAAQVNSGRFTGGNSYNCTANPASGPALSATTTGQAGTNNGCLFLGLGVRVVPSTGIIYTYPVLGNQYDASNNPISSYDTSALLPNIYFGNSGDLTTKYNMNFGKLLKATADDTFTDGSTQSVDSDFAGFYNGLSSGANASTGLGGTILTRGYPLTDSTTTNNSTVKAELLACVKETTNPCSASGFFNDWSLCYSSTASNQTALLTINSTQGGLNTNLSFAKCP